MLLTWLAPALLVIIAARQIYLARTQDLTYWKGGGFGMFSSVDPLRNRFLRTYLVTGQQELLLSRYGPGELEYLASRAMALPSEKNLSQLATSLASKRWEQQGGRIRNASAGRSIDSNPSMGAPEGVRGSDEGAEWDRSTDTADTPAAPITFSSVRVEIWRIRFDPAECRIVPVKLRGRSVDAPPSSPRKLPAQP